MYNPWVLVVGLSSKAFSIRLKGDATTNERMQSYKCSPKISTTLAIGINRARNLFEALVPGWVLHFRPNTMVVEPPLYLTGFLSYIHQTKTLTVCNFPK
jgi:hypothetical protein